MNFDVERFTRSCVYNVAIDIETSTVEIGFSWYPDTTETLRLIGLLSMTYQPDFTDEPPWVCLDFSVELINSMDELDQSEVLWEKGANALKDLSFPLYRFYAGSADFVFFAVCQEIELSTDS
ncbi:hypothetical protein [Grimontia sp. NTOU-MAR1]|uniref:hypothetical protein n=1 Tax=Grimontia sp. NTOU-MAR1 TaxID=3111011 RepID=UPI002DB66974|nr:hypothetical protein [Grimontia sp. NTOU-MAR1]WRV98332.1 hypothetical protein VP504_02535 [Grimontia sp. NTOU-MAR1]